LLIEPLDVLRSLVDKSLLTQVESTNGEPRFFMLETIREYALERLAAGGAEALVRQAHAAYFVAFAEAGAAGLRTAEELVWLDRFSSEHDNLRAALGWAAEHGPEQLARLCYALDTFWYWRGHWREGREWAERCVVHADQLSDQSRAHALVVAGNMASLQSDYATATGLFNDSLALYEQLDDNAGVVDALSGLGYVAGYGQNNYEKGFMLFQTGLAHARLLGDHYRQLKIIPWLVYLMPNHPEALAIVEEGLHLSRTLGIQTSQGYIHRVIGMLAREQGDLRKASAAQEASIALCTITGDNHGISTALNDLGLIASIEGDQERAIQFYSESLRIRRELGDRRGSVALYVNLAMAYTLAGEFTQSRTHAAEALRLASTLKHQQGQSWGLIAMANGLVDAKPEAALRLMGAAERHREENNILVWPPEEGDHERVHARARAALSDEAYAAAWAAGRALRIEAAVAEALGWAQNHGITEGRESHGTGSAENAEAP
jgi:tetratricopeptide (TPR) repeat protein